MSEKKQETKVNYRSLIKTDIEHLDQMNRETTSRVYGMSGDFLKKQEEETEKLREVINNVNLKNTSSTKTSVIDFFNTVAVGEKSKGKDKDGKEEQETENVFKNSLEAANNSGRVNQLFAQERERISNYHEFSSIEYYIPLVNQALQAISDAIISPDDHSKDVFNFTYNSHLENTLETSSESVVDNLKRLNEIYMIDEKAKDWIHETLTIGDKFITAFKYRREFDNLLKNESYVFNEAQPLSENNFKLSESENIMFNSIIKKPEGIDNYNFTEEVINLMNENLIYTSRTELLFEKEIQIQKDMKDEKNKKNRKKEQMVDMDDKNIINKANDGSILRNDEDKKKKKAERFSASNSVINGTYLRELEADRVVKIKVGSTVLGYFYAEQLEGKSNPLTDTPSRQHTQMELRRNIDMESNSQEDKDPKTSLIVDLFTKAISNKIDKKFIEDNKEFKTVVYELMKKNYLLNGKVRIAFISPEEMIHLKVQEDKNGYGVSELKKVHFIAKIYLAVLISNLMMKLSRSVDHRAFYIETGLSRDVENTINSFIRDIKTREVRLSDVQTVDTIFKSIGQFHDYFIPTVKGEKPVEFEIISGQDVQMDNDLLEYLQKALMSGLEVPLSYINALEDMDFSRSIAMQNTKFLRGIVVKQKKMDKEFTKLFRILYENEFEDDLNEKDNSVSVDKINVSFPSPATLNMTNLNDNISSADSIIEYIVRVTLGEEVNNDDKMTLTKLLAKKYLPQIPWDVIQEENYHSKISSIEDKLLKGSEGEEEDSGGY